MTTFQSEFLLLPIFLELKNPLLHVQLLFQHAILSANGQGRIFYFIQIHHLLLNNANKFYFIKELLRLGENDFGTVRE